VTRSSLLNIQIVTSRTRPLRSTARPRPIVSRARTTPCPINASTFSPMSLRCAEESCLVRRRPRRQPTAGGVWPRVPPRLGRTCRGLGRSACGGPGVVRVGPPRQLVSRLWPARGCRARKRWEGMGMHLCRFPFGEPGTRTTPPALPNQRRKALTKDACRFNHEAVRPKRHHTRLQEPGLPKHDRVP